MRRITHHYYIETNYSEKNYLKKNNSENDCLEKSYGVPVPESGVIFLIALKLFWYALIFFCLIRWTAATC